MRRHGGGKAKMKRTKEDETTEDCGLFNDAFSINERKERKKINKE
jgi:hypothetical protein